MMTDAVHTTNSRPTFAYCIASSRSNTGRTLYVAFIVSLCTPLLAAGLPADCVRCTATVTYLSETGPVEYEVDYAWKAPGKMAYLVKGTDSIGSSVPASDIERVAYCVSVDGSKANIQYLQHEYRQSVDFGRHCEITTLEPEDAPGYTTRYAQILASLCSVLSQGLPLAGLRTSGNANRLSTSGPLVPFVGRIVAGLSSVRRDGDGNAFDLMDTAGAKMGTIEVSHFQRSVSGVSWPLQVRMQLAPIHAPAQILTISSTSPDQKPVRRTWQGTVPIHGVCMILRLRRLSDSPLLMPSSIRLQADCGETLMRVVFHGYKVVSDPSDTLLPSNGPQASH